MDKSGQEWVSAAVDGEVDGQAIADLAADTESHEKWRNYHLIGDAIRVSCPRQSIWIFLPVLLWRWTMSLQLWHLK